MAHLIISTQTRSVSVCVTVNFFDAVASLIRIKEKL